jgi:hypothetical protein
MIRGNLTVCFLLLRSKVKNLFKHVPLLTLLFGIAFLGPVEGFCDTIVLKDGRRIEAEQVWLEGEMVRYKKYGTVVGLPTSQVARVITDASTSAGPVVDFGFDFWKLGMDINEVMDIAERNQVPLHREGLISVNKQFNPKMCRPYTDTHSRFDYRQQLLGYPTKVTLVFTPRSRRLAFIKVHLSPNFSASNPVPNDTVMAVMSKKYGQPRKISKNILQKNACRWRLPDDNTIDLTSGSNWTDLIYENASWKSVLEREAAHSQNLEQKANKAKDVGKF